MRRTNVNVASSVADLIAEGERVALDSSAMLSHLAQTEAVSLAATAVIEGLIASGRNDAVISAVTVSELLVHPVQFGGDAVRRLVGFLDSLDGLQIRSADFLMAAEAARIRAETGIPLPDALVIATAVLTSSKVLVTNDRRLADASRDAVPELRVVILSEVAAV